MDFLFVLSLLLLFLLLPIIIGAEGYFDANKKILSFCIKIWGIKIIRCKLFFHENRIFFSLNGKKGKTIEIGRKKEKGKRFSFQPFKALFFRDISVNIFAGGKVGSTTYLLGSISLIIDAMIEYLKRIKRLDRAKVIVLPCYTSNRAVVKFSISILTSPVLLLTSFTHTIRGEDYAKRSDREFDG